MQYSKINKKAKIISLIIFLLFLEIGLLGVKSSARAATYYMNANGSESCSNLQACFRLMSEGDELVIRDGTYVGVENTVTSSSKPPNGTASAFTVIRAEHDGKVFFDGEDRRDVFNLVNASYIKFKGLVWGNNNFEGAGVLVPVLSSHHIKFINCGAFDAHDGDDGHVFAAYGSSYLLYEGCYVWGSGDYAFIPGRDTEKVIYRRCVVRHDRQKGWPQGTIGFFPYGSRNIEIQNCIYVDANNPLEYYDARPVPWEFRYANQGFELQNVNFRGCVAINNTTGGISRGSTVSINTSVLFSNCISVGSYWGARFRYNGANLDHCTFLDISASSDQTWGRGVYFEGQGDNVRETISNSIIAKIPNNIGVMNGKSINNCLYGNELNYSGATSIDDITTVNPEARSLLYPLRIEDNSELDRAASDGEDIGATVLKKIGIDGTLWGEPGYDVITDESLWPFPNEDIIKENISKYNEYGINGTRGFCASGNGLYGGPITLTSYIWEYLGHPCPPDICNYSATDTTPPTLSNGSPSGTLASGTTQTTLSVTTNENATCKYGTTPHTIYDSIANTFSNTGGTTHTTTVTGLNSGQSYNYYIRCKDEHNNTNTNDYIISFNLANSSPTYSLANFISLVNHWLGVGDSNSDVNNDGIVNTRDLGIMMSNWRN